MFLKEQSGLAHFAAPSTIAKQYLPLVRVRILFFVLLGRHFHALAWQGISYKIKNRLITGGFM